MATPKQFIHDRVVLLLISINAFFTILISVLVSFAITGGSEKVFTLEHRPSLGLSANRAGSATQMSSFIVFVAFICFFNILLSKRVYPIRRNFAIVILGMGTLLILMTGVICSLLLKK